MMSEISVLGIDAANLLSITHWAFSELEISMSFSLAVAITALSPHCQKDCLNEAQHQYHWSDKHSVHHCFSHSSLSPFSTPTPCNTYWNYPRRTADFRGPAHEYVQGYVQVPPVDMYKDMNRPCSWICTRICTSPAHGYVQASVENCAMERAFTDSGNSRVLDTTFCKHL